MDKSTIFITKVESSAERLQARLLIESIRAFGGEYKNCPVWVFDLAPARGPDSFLENLDAQIIPLLVPEPFSSYLFGGKVFACAQAEELVGEDVQSLVWIDSGCLVVNPPELYPLSGSIQAAVRPVHIRNVGLLENEPVDAYWQGIFDAIGVQDIHFPIQSFVDNLPLRAYFNTHAFSINPARGLVCRWLELFSGLVSDQEFQASTCGDELHQIFLHQAVWSALLAVELERDQIRILPPEYNYPYHLQSRIPAARRAKSLNDLVTFAYEGCTIDPEIITDIAIHEPLRSWLYHNIE